MAMPVKRKMAENSFCSIFLLLPGSLPSGNSELVEEALYGAAAVGRAPKGIDDGAIAVQVDRHR
jgi:hypothetical protein